PRAACAGRRSGPRQQSPPGRAGAHRRPHRRRQRPPPHRWARPRGTRPRAALLRPGPRGRRAAGRAGLSTAVRSEALKLVRSPVGTIATLALVVGTLVLLGGITAALASGNPELTAKVGVGATLDWAGLLASAAQITSAGGLLGSGVVLAWLFGRE